MSAEKIDGKSGSRNDQQIVREPSIHLYMTESGNIEKWSKEKSLLKQSDAGSRIRQHFIASKNKRNHSS